MTDTDHRAEADDWLDDVTKFKIQTAETTRLHLLAALHDGQQEQTDLLRDIAHFMATLRHDNEHLMRTLDERLPKPPKSMCEQGLHIGHEPGGEGCSTPDLAAESCPSCLPSLGDRCGSCHRCTAPEPESVPRNHWTALAASAALEAAIHQVDDDEAAQTLARLADQWRAEADEHPHPKADPEPESVTVSLPERICHATSDESTHDWFTQDEWTVERCRDCGTWRRLPEPDTFNDVIAVVQSVVQSRALSIGDAWAVLAAARPAIEREAKAAALREAADRIDLQAAYEHDGSEYRNAESAAESWLREEAHRIEQEADQ